MAALTGVTPDIRVEIPEVPSFVAERQLLRATREFCEETRAWRESFDLTTIADTALYDLVSEAALDTVELVDVVSIKNTDGGEPVRAKTYSWLDDNLSDWRGETSDDAQYYVLDSNNTIRLVYTPASAVTDHYHVRMAVKPLLTATAINDVILNKYRETLISGALARLYLIPRKPWTDAALGSYHRQQFELRLPEARSQAADEFQTGVGRKVKYGGL